MITHVHNFDNGSYSCKVLQISVEGNFWIGLVSTLNTWFCLIKKSNLIDYPTERHKLLSFSKNGKINYTIRRKWRTRDTHVKDLNLFVLEQKYPDILQLLVEAETEPSSVQQVDPEIDHRKELSVSSSWIRKGQ